MSHLVFSPVVQNLDFQAQTHVALLFIIICDGHHFAKESGYWKDAFCQCT